MNIINCNFVLITIFCEPLTTIAGRSDVQTLTTWVVQYIVGGGMEHFPSVVWTQQNQHYCLKIRRKSLKNFLQFQQQVHPVDILDTLVPSQSKQEMYLNFKAYIEEKVS